MKVYLAGKICPAGWRRKLFIDDDNLELGGERAIWPLVARGVLYGGHDYTGPYFTRGHDQGHGSYGPDNYGDNSHGNNCNNDRPEPLVAKRVPELCRVAIDNSDFVWCYINARGAYGTAAEIGYAIAKGKPCFVFIEHEFAVRDPSGAADYWFLSELAHPGKTYQLWDHGDSDEEMRRMFLWCVYEAQKHYIDTFVYFIHATGTNRVKIGFSATPRTRLAQMQTGSPTELVLLGACRGTMETEKRLHAQFAHLRVGSGEWFSVNDELKEFIISNCREYISSKLYSAFKTIASVTP